MAQITFKGSPLNTVGTLPSVGDKAPSFKLTAKDLSDKTLADFGGKIKILSIVPSLDTPVCLNSTKRFNAEAGAVENAVVLVISADLPFAQSRNCETAGVANVETLSTMRSCSFGTDYGVEIAEGPLAGLLSRAVLVIDSGNKVVYAEQVPEIAQEPDYEAALSAARNAD